MSEAATLPGPKQLNSLADVAARHVGGGIESPADVSDVRIEKSPADLSDVRIASGVTEVDGKPMMRDAKGRFVPLGLVKPVDRLMDDTVRRMVAFARDLSERIARFRGHCFDDLGAFQALIAEKYEASVGGEKGNVTLTSFDGCQKVQFQVSDWLGFGPEMQAAKALVDACLAEWTAEGRDEIRAIVTRAFNVDQEGIINRAAVFMLLRVDIADERWRRAMDAIHESIRVFGSSTYIRFYERDHPRAKWRAVTIDLAASSASAGDGSHAGTSAGDGSHAGTASGGGT